MAECGQCHTEYATTKQAVDCFQAHGAGATNVGGAAMSPVSLPVPPTGSSEAATLPAPVEGATPVTFALGEGEAYALVGSRLYREHLDPVGRTYYGELHTHESEVLLRLVRHLRALLEDVADQEPGAVDAVCELLGRAPDVVPIVSDAAVASSVSPS